MHIRFRTWPRTWRLLRLCPCTRPLCHQTLAGRRPRVRLRRRRDLTSIRQSSEGQGSGLRATAPWEPLLLHPVHLIGIEDPDRRCGSTIFRPRGLRLGHPRLARDLAERRARQRAELPLHLAQRPPGLRLRFPREGRQQREQRDPPQLPAPLVLYLLELRRDCVEDQRLTEELLELLGVHLVRLARLARAGGLGRVAAAGVSAPVGVPAAGVRGHPRGHAAGVAAERVAGAPALVLRAAGGVVARVVAPVVLAAG
mmetsp:Transcript_126956/g.353570  ORF Transcript_126956/g.353570 Transcript_126956/m.353570 type:complete len:255 (-) Transcript_126956:504-1268(-)